jgi:hypothetical protein
MTGPRIPTVHPHRRRGRQLLPFLAAILLGPLACTSDQPMGPTSPQGQPSATISRAHPYLGTHTASSLSAASSSRSTSLSVFSASLSTGPAVLILSDVDAASTTALADTLADAGFQVSVRPAPEYTWSGADPSLAGYAVVVHLNGATFSDALSWEAQAELNSFVQNGGGFIGAQWNGYELTLARQTNMPDLVLDSVGGRVDTPDSMYPEKNCGFCQITFNTVEGQEAHPVVAGLSPSFTFTADAHDAGAQVEFASEPSTVLMRVTNGGPAVIVRQVGAGRVVNFSFAANYPYDDTGEVHEPVTLLDPKIKRLYVNSVRWAAGLTADDEAQPQTITFDALADKVFGDAAFTVSASASSDLPVSFDATGQCTIVGLTVTITSAGSCTITAHQAGNALYLEAPDVARSFNIAKAPAMITVGTEYTFDGTVKSAAITTNPEGLSGVTVSYTQNGIVVLQPINAGVYEVVATLDNPNYQAPLATGTLTINPASPSIQWVPAPLTAGTSLGLLQLNATATGVGSVPLSGTWTYTPPAGTVLPAGPATLSVQFSPSDPNYGPAARSVNITVVSAINFSGFFVPVRNMPVVNVVTAGTAVPLRFSLGGSLGLQVLQPGSPISMQVQCGSDALRNTIEAGSTPPTGTGLSLLGYTYTYVWRTNAAWAGTCRKFVLTLIDGSTHEAMFLFPAVRGRIRRVW